MMKEKKTVLELFGGCGGLGYGFHSINFNIVCCNELESQIAQTYIHNFPETKVVVGDITTDNIKKEILLEFENNECNIIIGGPPCVAYSLSGKRDPRDPRGQLFRDYIYLVNTLRPDVCVMENVKGILTIMHDKDNLNIDEQKIANEYYKLEKTKIDLESKKKHNGLDECEKSLLLKIKKDLNAYNEKMQNIRIPVSEKIKKTFNDIGYNVEYKLHNSADFGAPQTRERIIFIAVRKDLKMKIKFPKKTHSKTDELKPWVTVREAIDDLKDLKEDKNFSQIYSKHSQEFIDKIKATKIGKSVNPKYTEANFKCNPDLPSNTVKENHGAVFVHYEKNRSMTPRELARLQGFPDDFIFKGTKTSILKQLGNAVPCNLSLAIANSIKKMYKK